ncbi:cytochrome c-type biogenesis protein Ccs1/ResB [Dehalogenimonas sp. WBC-2]|nr:cytochrome c-type biogenesis protein Ccs1/ResB [Dehalogenimonas sp. WBC-2]
MGSYFGYSDDSFIVAENQTRAITGYSFSLHLDSFEDEYWPDGSPKDFRSQITIIENGLVVKEALVRVNHPLEYKGLKIFQSFYGPAVAVTVKDIDGNPIFQDSVVFDGSLSDQGIVWPFGTFTLGDNNLFCAIISSAGPSDPLIPAGELRLEFYDMDSVEFLDSFPFAVGTPVEYQGLSFSADYLGQFSGFQLKEDPGLVLIWIAFALLMAGLFLVFYFPHRQIIISIQPGQTGSSYSYAFLGKKSLASDEIQSLTETLNGVDVETHERKSQK